MAAAVALQLDVAGERLRVPRDAWRLDGFRTWMTSPAFPAQGVRATFVDGEVLIDMSPESLESHNKVKTAITIDVGRIVREKDLGELYSDRMLLTHDRAGVSTEPDLCFARWQTLASGRLRPAPRATREGEFVELVGSPDLVVEILSDSSEDKDLRLLRAAYARARVPEYWIIDARGSKLRFEILRLSGRSYRAAAPSGRAQASAVLGLALRLRRTRNRVGRWSYALEASRRGR
jgi:Uma2 family endonuclease